MDKGLDIELTYCALALHATLFLAPNSLAYCLGTLRRKAQDGASPANLRQATEALAHQVRASAPNWRAASEAITWCGPGRTVLLSFDTGYPPLLRTISSAPPILFVRGEVPLLSAPQIAVIGSRNATPTGRENAHQLATELSKAQFAVTSGMARGIDTAAHRGALSQDGHTLAVFGCGIDQTYPKENARLSADITERGALISEFPLGTPPLARHFPLRNRIISGLAAGTVVVEASLASGSLITAHFALEQGREVFAVPGSIRNPMAKGCHGLIQQGAQLVESVEDIISALPLHSLPPSICKPRRPEQSQANFEFPVGSRGDAVINALGYEPATIDMLLERTGLTHKMLSSILLELELSGSVRALAGGYYERPAPSRHRSS